MACGRHFFCTFNTFIDQELPNQISYSSIKMKSLSIIIMYYIIVKQVIWNNERPFHSAFVISSHFWQLKVVEQKKLDFFFPISNQLTLCQLLYSIEHSTDFRVFFHLFLPLSVCYLSGLYNVILFQFFISIDFTSCEWMMMANDFVPSTFLSHSIIVIVLTYFTLYHRRMCICISLHEQNFKLFYSLFLCFVIWFRCSRNKQEKKTHVCFFLLLWNTWK